jgi:HlyD family type I secretion membrane fusion protein
MTTTILLPPRRDVAPLPAPSRADPTRDIRLGAIVAMLFFVLFLGWAAFIRLDAAAYAPGTLVVSGQRQSVQHRDGGVVGRIFVREGQRVERGQLLMQLAAAEVQAQERALASQSIRLLAQRARLQAEELGKPAFAPPREFSGLAPEDRAEAAVAMRLQRIELAARNAVLAAQRDTLGQRVVQSSEQGRGYGRQADSTEEQLRLVEEQIRVLRPVADKGFVSQTRMRDLERARAELRGRGGQYRASVAQTHGAVGESRMQMLETERSFRERTAADLRDVESRLGEALPKWIAARDQLERPSSPRAE